MQSPKADGRQVAWHALSPSEVCAALRTDFTGLDQREAQERLAQSGPNCLARAKGRPALLRFLLQFHNVLIYVLMGAAAITAFLGHWIDTGVVLAVVLANAVIGFVQEGKAEQAMDAIRHMLAPRANVIRDGQRMSIPGEQLVPGDVVLLEAGDKVPADVRLTTVHGLALQEALLTGESLPVDKSTHAAAPDAALGDRSCMAFSGTLVTMGQAKGVVVSTGAQTEIGHISGLLSEVQTLTTPLSGKWGRLRNG